MTVTGTGAVLVLATLLTVALPVSVCVPNCVLAGIVCGAEVCNVVTGICMLTAGITAAASVVVLLVDVPLPPQAVIKNATQSMPIEARPAVTSRSQMLP